MFWKVFWFELKYRLRAPSTWVCFTILLAFVYRETLAGQWDSLISSGRVARNSPYVIYYVFMYYTWWTATIGGGLVIQSILRDIHTRAGSVIYSYPINSASYFWGKYAAAMTIVILVASSVVVGFIFMPWVGTTFHLRPAEQFIATSWAHLGQAYLIWTLPGCFIYGSIFYALAAFTGRAGPSYAAMATLLGIFVMLAVTFGEAERSLYPFVSILDPLGKATLESQIFYWSADERMNRFLSFDGAVLQNRLLYLGASAAVLIAVAARFDLRGLLGRVTRREVATAAAAQSISAREIQTKPSLADRIAPVTTGVGHFARVCLAGGWQEFMLTTRENHFRVAASATLVIIFGTAWGSIYAPPDGSLLPLAVQILPRTSTVAALLCLMAVSFYAAEIAGRERTVRIAPLVDACPAPSWALMGSKVIGALLIALLFAVIPTLGALVILAFEQFREPTLALYWQVTLFWLLPSTVIFALTATACYAITRNKVTAQALAIIISITAYIFEELRTFEHPLTVWSTPFRIALSDFDLGAQPLVRSATLAGYWISVFAFLGVAVAYCLWPRGETRSLRSVWARARGGGGVFAAALLCSAIALGIHIHRVVDVRNHYQSDAQLKAEDASYEKTYGALRSVSQPTVKAAELSVDIHPSTGSASYTAKLAVSNTTQTAISALHMEPMEFLQLSPLVVDGRTVNAEPASENVRHFVYTLPAPLMVGAQSTLDFSASVQYSGFAEERLHGTLFKDASYIPAAAWPKFGYDRTRELITTGDRKDHMLGERVALADAAAGAMTFGAAYDTDRAIDGTHLSVTSSITTDADQIALAPGELVNESKNGDRHTFVYRSAPPQLWNPHMISGRYDVRRAGWSGTDPNHGVAIEIYFNPKHTYNVDRFIEAAKLALTQGTRLWGPYPYRTLRIAEAPNDVLDVSTHAATSDLEPVTIVTSGNLTVIPEDNGWTHDYRSTPKIDWITYLVAREVSRAWWGQTLRPANTAGAVLINEGVPALHGLLALEERSGFAAARSYVDILTESYLRMSAREDRREQPITAADQLGYAPDRIYAPDRAALAVHELYRAAGAERFLALLREYFSASGSNPASVGDLSSRIMAAGLSPFAEAIAKDALFEAAIYDYRIRETKVSALGNGVYSVRADIECTRLAAQNGLDRKPIADNDPVQVTFYGSDGKQIESPAAFAQCDAGTALLEVELPSEPRRMEVDPLRLRVDRNLKDNKAELTTRP